MMIQNAMLKLRAIAHLTMANHFLGLAAVSVPLKLLLA
jgi:hypothetical protein